MKHIHYDATTILVGDDVADAVIEYAAALAGGDRADTVDVPAVADDSGLCVDVLGGAPGVFSARWCGRHGDDDANLRLLLAQISDVADEHRGARFTCAAVLARPGAADDLVVERSMEGRILRSPRGGGGFGYDPVFVPEGESRTSSEMTSPEKDAISHRGNALRALVPVLRDLLRPGS